MPATTLSVSAAMLPATVDPVAMPLERCSLAVDARGGLARVTLVQRFRNDNDEPLSVSYRLPLPADAAVSGFTFRIGERVVRGAVDGRKQARERFERAVYEGRGAALLEQERSSLFTQELANIPPREAVEVEIELDQPLAWLVEGRWEWRFPLAAAPRYLGSGPCEGDVSVAVASGALGARASLSMRVRDAVPEGKSPESPSHPIVCDRAMGSFGVELGSGNQVQLDRDVVVRWPVATLRPGASLDVARPRGAAGAASAYGLLTVVPPSLEAAAAPVPRDLTLLIDTSGSMSGEPLAQAKRVVAALIDSLSDRDQLELIEFSDMARSFKPGAEAATPTFRREALRWVSGLEASGGTEMLSGVRSALRELRPGSQRQIVLVTDGLVGFEREIVRALLDGLPVSARLHALGVGSAVNRALLAPIARAGRGVEAIVGLGEDPERAAQRILARTAAPQVVDLRIEGDAVQRTMPHRLPDVYMGCPLRVAVALAPNGGELVVRGRTAAGPFEQVLRVSAAAPGEGSPSVVKLFGREEVEDLEMQISAGRAGASCEQQIEQVGLAFEIATRFTSWLAISAQVLVDPRDAARHVVQAHELPHGMSAAGLGLRPAGASASVAAPGRARSNEVARPTRVLLGASGATSAPMAKRAMSAREEGGVADDEREYAPAPALAREADLELSDARPSPTGAPPPASAAPPPPPAPARRAPLAPPAAPAPEKPSLLESAKRKIAKVFEKKESADAASAASLRALPARIAHVDGDRVIVELVAPASGLALSFAQATATLVAADGADVAAEIVVDESAHERTHLGGVVLRIVLRVSLAGRPIGGRVELPASGVVLELR